MTFLDFNLGVHIIPAQSWFVLTCVLKGVLDALNSGEHAFGLFATQPKVFLTWLTVAALLGQPERYVLEGKPLDWLSSVQGLPDRSYSI